MSAEQAANDLLALRPQILEQPVYDDPGTQAIEQVQWLLPTGQTFPNQEFDLRRRVIGWWLHEALHDTGIGHKMTFFWHQHLATSIMTYNHALFFDYLSLLRWGALGNVKKLATKMVADNNMLVYLNGHDNSRTSPNENFAREFFELFTIGKGPQAGPEDYTNYTEEDIVQAARVLTGWRRRQQRDNYDPETNIPRGTTTISRHDTGNKTFSARFQNTVIQGATTAAAMYTELDAFVNMVFAQPETARSYARRVYRFFVHPRITPEIEQDIIGPMGDTLRDNNYEILPMMQQLLKSQHFYDMDDAEFGDQIIGGIIRSPLDMALQSLSFFNITIPDPITANATHYTTFYGSGVNERMLGMANLNLFVPPDVAGYSAYHQGPEFSRHWFNSTSIIARYKLPQMLLSGRRSIGGSPNTSIGIKLNIVPWVRNSGITADPSDPYLLVKDLLDYMLPGAIDEDRFNYFYDKVFLNELPAYDWTYEWEDYLQTNNETEVKLALERLIQHIMYSQEYQTS